MRERIFTHDICMLRSLCLTLSRLLRVCATRACDNCRVLWSTENRDFNMCSGVQTTLGNATSCYHALYHSTEYRQQTTGSRLLLVSTCTWCRAYPHNKDCQNELDSTWCRNDPLPRPLHTGEADIIRSMENVCSPLCRQRIRPRHDLDSCQSARTKTCLPPAAPTLPAPPLQYVGVARCWCGLVR